METASEALPKHSGHLHHMASILKIAIPFCLTFLVSVDIPLNLLNLKKKLFYAKVSKDLVLEEESLEAS